MFIFGAIQTVIFLVLGIACVVAEVWAFVDAVRRPARAYLAAGKQTKVLWCAITGVAAAIGILGLPPLSAFQGFGGLLSIAAVVAALVYLVSVRPALEAQGPGPRGPSGPGGSW